MNSLAIGSAEVAPVSTTVANQVAFSDTYTSLRTKGLAGHAVDALTYAITLDPATGEIKTGGNIQNVGKPSPLTLPGDMLIRGPADEDPLAIGTEGQVLTVTSGYPAWQTPVVTPVYVPEFYALQLQTDYAHSSTTTYLTNMTDDPQSSIPPGIGSGGLTLWTVEAGLYAITFNIGLNWGTLDAFTATIQNDSGGTVVYHTTYAPAPKTAGGLVSFGATIHRMLPANAAVRVLTTSASGSGTIKAGATRFSITRIAANYTVTV